MYSSFFDLTKLRTVCLLTPSSLAACCRESQPSGACCDVRRLISSSVRKISQGLAKIAALPYKEEVYNSVQEIMKIASETFGEFADSFKTVQDQASNLEKAAEVRSLIDEMVKVGAVDEFNIEDKVVELMEKTSEQLEVTKEAMKLVKEGRDGNIFSDETEKDAGFSSSGEKKGMFDNVIPN